MFPEESFNLLFFYLYYEFSLTYILYPFPSPLFFTDNFLSPFLPLYLGDRLNWLPVLLRALDRCLSLYTASTLPLQEYSILFLRYYILFYKRSVNEIFPFSLLLFWHPFCNAIYSDYFDLKISHMIFIYVAPILSLGCSLRHCHSSGEFTGSSET